jgi:hypothetical protein
MGVGAPALQLVRLEAQTVVTCDQAAAGEAPAVSAGGSGGKHMGRIGIVKPFCSRTKTPKRNRTASRLTVNIAQIVVWTGDSYEARSCGWVAGGRSV